MQQTDAVLAVLKRLTETEARMTPKGWSKCRLYALLRCGRKSSGAWDLEDAIELYGEEARGEIPDEDDADGIVALRNAAPAMIAALRACVAERELRLEPDEDPHYFDRLYELQEAADAALAELARVGREGTE